MATFTHRVLVVVNQIYDYSEKPIYWLLFYRTLMIVFRNNDVLGYTLSNQFVDANKVAGAVYNYTVQAVGEFGALSRLATPIQTLPLNLLSFTATLKKDLVSKVELAWKTTSEKNTASFNLERTIDGQTFESVGTVAALNTSGIHTYNFVDLKPLSGRSYYRLNQIDLDGKNKYSDLRVIDNFGDLKLVLYPNPVINELNIIHTKSTAGGSIEIMTMDGKSAVKVGVQPSTSFTKLDVSKLYTGTYVLVFKNGTETSIAKFVKN